MGDSNFEEWEVKTFVGSFFTIVLLSFILTGSGALATEVGQPPTLNESETGVDLNTSDFPEEPSIDESVSTIETGEQYEWTISDRTQLTKTWFADWFLGITTISGSEVTFYTYETASFQEEELTLSNGNSGTIKYGDDRQSSLDIRVDSISAGPDQSNTVTFTILSDDNNSGGGIPETVFYIGSIISWGFSFIFGIITDVVSSLATIGQYNLGLVWYLISLWTSVGALIPGVLGLLFQGFTLVLFVLLFNGVIKILKVLPTT